MALFLNTMAADDKTSLRSRDNFVEQTQIQLSQGPKTFSGFFFAFLKITLHFQYFLKKEECHSLSFSGFLDSERDGYLNV